MCSRATTSADFKTLPIATTFSLTTMAGILITPDVYKRQELTHAVSTAVGIPVIASGGAGKKEHFYDAFTKGRCV